MRWGGQDETFADLKLGRMDAVLLELVTLTGRLGSAGCAPA